MGHGLGEDQNNPIADVGEKDTTEGEEALGWIGGSPEDWAKIDTT